MGRQKHLFKISDSMKHHYKSDTQQGVDYGHYRVDSTQLESYFPHELKKQSESIHSLIFDIAFERYLQTDIPNKAVLMRYPAHYQLMDVRTNYTLDALFMQGAKGNHSIQTLHGRGTNVTYKADLSTNKIRSTQICVLSQLYVATQNQGRFLGSTQTAEEVLYQFSGFVTNSSWHNFYDLAKTKLQRRINGVKTNWNLKELDIDTDIFSFFKLQV